MHQAAAHCSALLQVNLVPVEGPEMDYQAFLSIFAKGRRHEDRVSPPSPPTHTHISAAQHCALMAPP